MTYKLRSSARGFLALTKKSSFFEVPLIEVSEILEELEGLLLFRDGKAFFGHVAEYVRRGAGSGAQLVIESEFFFFDGFLKVDVGHFCSVAFQSGSFQINGIPAADSPSLVALG